MILGNGVVIMGPPKYWKFVQGFNRHLKSIILFLFSTLHLYEDRLELKAPSESRKEEKALLNDDHSELYEDPEFVPSQALLPPSSRKGMRFRFYCVLMYECS